MGAESNMRGRILEILRPLDAVAVENPAHPGTPDINHLHGWLELKQIDGWPVREDTAVSVPKFRNEQKIWLRRRARLGIADLLLRVGKEWLLFTGDVAAASLGCLPRLPLVGVALAHWPRGLNGPELLDLCRRDTRKS